MRGSCTKASNMAMTLSLLALRTLITCSHVNLYVHNPLAEAAEGGAASQHPECLLGASNGAALCL